MPEAACEGAIGQGPEEFARELADKVLDLALKSENNRTMGLWDFRRFLDQQAVIAASKEFSVHSDFAFRVRELVQCMLRVNKMPDGSSV